MLETQNEIEEAISRPITNDTTDMTELETELEDLLKQPMPATPATSLPKNPEIINTPVANEPIKPPEQDPFAELELRLQKLGVQDCKIIFSFFQLIILFSSLYLAKANKVPQIASSNS